MRYLIDGCYGDGNVGDEALLHATIQLIRNEDSNSQITVLSSDTIATECEFDVPCVLQCNPFGRNIYGAVGKGLLFRAITAIRAADLFVLGGGELFRDDVGLNATLGMFYRMKLARLLGKRIWALGVGAQPATTWWGRRVLKSALLDTDACTFRDVDSLRVADDLAPQLQTSTVGPDIVFGLDWSAFRNRHRNLGNAFRPWQIGIAMKSVPDRHPHHRQLHSDLPHAMTQCMAKINKLFPCQVTLLPFATSDTKATEQYRKELTAAGVEVRDIASPCVYDLRESISQLDAVVAVPLHASIFSFASGTPTLGIAYDSKVSKLYESFSMSARCVAISDIQADSLYHKLCEIMVNRWMISDRLTRLAKEANGMVRRLFSQNYAQLNLKVLSRNGQSSAYSRQSVTNNSRIRVGQL